MLNRLVAIDFADGTSATYRYDAQGRRIEKSVNGVISRYVYDREAILLEYDGANAFQARYAHDEEIDQSLSMARGGARYFYQADHLGSIRLITDAAGAIIRSSEVGGRHVRAFARHASNKARVLVEAALHSGDQRDDPVDVGLVAPDAAAEAAGDRRPVTPHPPVPRPRRCVRRA